MPARPGALPMSLAADGTALWAVQAPIEAARGLRALKLDAGTGRRLGGGPLHGEAGSIALGAGGIWMITDVSSVLVGGRHFGGLEKLDPRTGKRELVLPPVDAEGLAASSRSVWTRHGDGRDRARRSRPRPQPGAWHLADARVRGPAHAARRRRRCVGGWAVGRDPLSDRGRAGRQADQGRPARRRARAHPLGSVGHRVVGTDRYEAGARGSRRGHGDRARLDRPRASPRRSCRPARSCG